MEFNEKVAEITLNPETKQVTKTLLYQRNLKFKCQRCATFCCKLGGPRLSREDIECIRRAGHTKVFHDDSNGLLKTRGDGACIFLRFDYEKGVYDCSVYDFRPALCRLYPFHLERTNANSLTLKLIPCCKGINDPHGMRVNAKFVNQLVKHLI